MTSSYFARIKRIYDFRYYSQEIIGLNYAISRNYYLAELDYTFSILEPITKIESPNRPVETSAYKADIKSKHQALYGNNYILNRIPKEAIFGGEDFILAGIVTADYENYNAEITGPMNEFFNKFDGCGVKVDGGSFEVIMPPNTKDIAYVRNHI